MIDWARVHELENEVGQDDFAEIAGLFLEEVDEVIERLRQFPQELNLEDDFHFLKGSALNLGFQAFSVLCAAAEKQAASGEQSKIDITGAIQCYELSCEIFREERRTRTAA